MNRSVSVIVPCYNEEKTITGLLESLFRQTYPLALMEVIVSDGLSTDGTRERIRAFQAENLALRILIIDNEKKIIPAGLNRAIDHARGDIIIRMDAHSKPYLDYIERCVKALEENRGDNVGGIWIIRPGANSLVAKSIAKAGSSPIGVGDALYRFAENPTYVDTVPFGAFYKELLIRVGKYDESLLTNEDYELNTRIRKSGGKIWLDPNIKSEYFARATYGDLCRQFFRYGFWKWKMLKRYGSSLRYRQALPPLFVIDLVILMIGSIFLPIFRWILLFGILSYAVILIGASFPVASHEKEPGLIFGMPIAIALMHLSWGTGFLVSLMGIKYH